MPFTSDEITELGLFSLDRYEKNKPIDQIGYERPFLRDMMRGKKAFPGAKQYIDENLRYKYDSNLQWYYGDQIVTYNKRKTIMHAKFPWRSAHDGFSLNEDELASNGIEIDERGKPQSFSDGEMHRLLNMFDENIEVLREGFEESFEKELLRDGTQDADAVEGLDALIATDPTSGTPGQIDRATYGWWRNNYATAVAGANLIDTMESHWRFCIRNGGKPDAIYVGSDFVDEFRTQAKTEIARYTILNTNGGTVDMDPSVTGLHFHHVPLVWVPAFEELDTEDSPAIPWEKRCYFINRKHLRLRPMKGYDMKTRTPPRVYDRYAYYWGLQWKGAVCMNRSNAHSVIAIA